MHQKVHYTDDDTLTHFERIFQICGQLSQQKLYKF